MLNKLLIMLMLHIQYHLFQDNKQIELSKQFEQHLLANYKKCMINRLHLQLHLHSKNKMVLMNIIIELCKHCKDSQNMYQYLELYQESIDNHVLNYIHLLTIIVHTHIDYDIHIYMDYIMNKILQFIKQSICNVIQYLMHNYLR